ncbi:MAG: isoprenylcysteine carboxylmethyltransferase family protein [Vulcanimicrobiaceae bacterium]
MLASDDDSPRDGSHPRVLAPPPLIFGIALGCGLALDRDARSTAPHAALDRRLGAAAVAGGAGLGIVALATLATSGTSPNPYVSDTTLVTRGPYRWTRNPAYVGATCAYIGIALYARSLRALTFLPIALALLDRAVVEPEERYLESRFGDAYRTYRARVPRWF